MSSVWFSFVFTISLSIMVSSQDCNFDLDTGATYTKCAAICEGRSFKCIADGTCLCKSCPNGMGTDHVHTHEDVSCEFTQECSRKCMEANSDPDFSGNIGRGKKCDFVEDFYGNQVSVCACACL